MAGFYFQHLLLLRNNTLSRGVTVRNEIEKNPTLPYLAIFCRSVLGFLHVNQQPIVVVVKKTSFDEDRHKKNAKI